MINVLPIYAAIRNEWKTIDETPVLGKDVLELLSSSMYVNPLSVYREYVQNAADSIEEACAIGSLSRTADGRIDIQINQAERTVRIRDNGTGLEQTKFVSRLIALGASRKRGLKARGFRGVGRLAGLGYCQELIFRSRAEGENEICELRWDCRALKSNLRDPKFSEQLSSLIARVVRTRRAMDSNYPDRFFEVEMVGVMRSGSDVLMNASAVGAYLGQVAPVPFSPEFTPGSNLNLALGKAVPMGNVRIYLNESSEPLYRPHKDDFVARKGVSDRISNVNVREFHGSNGALSAIAWWADHSYLGAISSETGIGGLRLRCGNIQIGEHDLLNDLFQESRFNSWIVGEVHVLDDRILPNGRRDHFEQSVHFSDLLTQLGPLAHDLGKKCRESSIQRNALREYQLKRKLVEDNLLILKQGAISQDRARQIEADTRAALDLLRRFHSGRVKDERLLRLMARKTESLRVRAEAVFSKTHSAPELKSKSKADRLRFEQIFGMIYECSTEHNAAKGLIDRILKKLDS